MECRLQKYHVQTGECRVVVTADAPATAAREALRQFLADHPDCRLGQITVISTHGWPCETGAFSADDHLMATVVLLEQLGYLKGDQ